MSVAHYDVCVMGAGPAGSMNALRLVQLGYAVAIVDRQRRDRAEAPVIESLSLGVARLLGEIGFGGRIEAEGLVHRAPSFVRWSSSTAESGLGESLLVERRTFDKRLLAFALAVGAKRHEGSVKDVRRFEKKRLWKVRLDSGTEISCSFLVDATGKRNVLGGRKTLHGQPTLALSADWRVKRDSAVSWVEAGRSAWYWGARMPDGSGRAIAFIDLPSDREVLKSEASRENLYCELMSESVLFRTWVSGEQWSRVHACPANVCADGSPVSRSYIKIGDGSLTLDPLSSQGIHRALASALTGAVVTNTILRRPEAADHAISFYQTREQESLDEHRGAAVHLYQSSWRPATKFWRSRSTGENLPDFSLSSERAIYESDVVLQSSETKITDAPVIEGEFVVPGKVLTHHALSRPVAYVGGIPVVPLIQSMGPVSTVGNVERTWSQFSPDKLRQCLAWMASRGLIVVRAAGA